MVTIHTIFSGNKKLLTWVKLLLPSISIGQLQHIVLHDSGCGAGCTRRKLHLK